MEQETSCAVKLLKIYEILKQDSDEDNPMPSRVLLENLLAQGISCTRQTLYKYIDMLNDSGYEVLCHRGIGNKYYVADRSFDMPELRILMDAVHAASFVTPHKTDTLIDKIANLGGSHRAELLKTNSVEFNTTKHTNEAIYYSVNEIEQALQENKQISFFYFDYNERHERVFRKDKKRYIVNPYTLVFTNDNYYLVCFSEKYKKINHYRVDRMENVEIEKNEVSDIAKQFISEFDIKEHRKELFGMYSGEVKDVSFSVDKSLIDVILDKFGEDTQMASSSDSSVVFDAKVQVSPQFLAWCCSLGDRLKVTSPNSVRRELKEYIGKLAKVYEE